MTKTKLAVICTFLFVIANMFRRRRQMQKSPVWKGFLSESLQIEDYRNLSLFEKLVFWVNYPTSYFRYLQVILWDHIDRLNFRSSRARYTKMGSINFGVKH